MRQVLVQPPNTVSSQKVLDNLSPKSAIYCHYKININTCLQKGSRCRWGDREF